MYQQFGEKGGLIDKVHVDIMWVVAKMSMSVHVRGVGGQSNVHEFPSLVPRWSMKSPCGQISTKLI